MRASYGVVWREGTKPLARGKLELLPHVLRLHGMTGSTPTTREIAYESLAEVHIGRSSSERIDGHPSLVVAPRSGDVVSIASVAQSGVLAEIAERLASLQHDAASHTLTVVLPLLPDARDTVVALLAAGPPFDPEELHLDRHRVLLTESEAIFFFESPLGADALLPLFQDPQTWERAAAWHEVLAGPPRIAEDVFAWTRAGQQVDRALLPPGLRNGDT